jgi:hypothetical protein
MPTRKSPLQLAIGFLAVLLGAANAAGGYVVTERMLGMFKAKAEAEGACNDRTGSSTAYFVAAVLFILGLKAMSSPVTAARASCGPASAWCWPPWSPSSPRAATTSA